MATLAGNIGGTTNGGTTNGGTTNGGTAIGATAKSALVTLMQSPQF